MAEVQEHQVVSNRYHGPDRRRGGPLGWLQRALIWLVRSKWIAMFAIAFAVSYGFAMVDNIGERRLDRQQRITLCVVKGVADRQALIHEVRPQPRVQVGPILTDCEEREGKK